MFTSLTIAGIAQAVGWWFGFPTQQWHIMMQPALIFRVISGIMIVIGQLLFAYNVFKTARMGKPIEGGVPAQ